MSRMALLIGVLAATSLMLGCAATAGAIAGAAAPGAQARRAPTPAKLMLFGGDGHKTYLGCLNCSKYDADSAMNQFGTHGSRYSSESIFNHYSDFGSRYSSYGACNPYAVDPPVIVDAGGSYYGRLTLNRYHTEIGVGTQWMGWLAAVCAE